MKKKILIILSMLFTVCLCCGIVAACGEPAEKPQGETVYTVTVDGKVYTVVDGEPVPRPDDPVRDGYRFDGWFSGGALYDFFAPVHGDITLEAHFTQLENTLAGTLVSLHGPIAGATVSLSGGKTATTDGEGNFAFDGTPAGSYTVTAEAEGYEALALDVPEDGFDDLGRCALGEACMALSYVEIGSIGTEEEHYTVYGTRNDKGLLFRAVTERTAFALETETLEFWFSVGETVSAVRNEDVWLLQCFRSGRKRINNYPDNVMNNLADGQKVLFRADWTVRETDTVLDVFVPYEVFGSDIAHHTSPLAAGDVLGLSMTLTNSTGSNLFLREDMLGADNRAEVTRGNRFDYLRLDSYNNLYTYRENKEVYTVSGTISTGREPLAGADVTFGGVTVQTDEAGKFTLQAECKDVEGEGTLTFRKAGYAEGTETLGADPSQKYYTLTLEARELTGTLKGIVRARTGEALGG